jgi:hypothetical protein
MYSRVDRGTRKEALTLIANDASLKSMEEAARQFGLEFDAEE